MSLFIVNGSVQLKVFEAVDLFDSLKLKSIKKTNRKAYVYAVISILDENDVLQHSYQTIPCLYDGSIFRISEEFVFEKIYSSYNLIISFVSILAPSLISTSDLEPDLIGIAKIPISRLEENISVRI
jgi:hypothetical protein